jgi:hypothetical protein
MQVLDAKKGNLNTVALAARTAPNEFYARRILHIIEKAPYEEMTQPAVRRHMEEMLADAPGSVETTLSRLPEWRRALRSYDGASGISDVEELVKKKLRDMVDAIHEKEIHDFDTLRDALALLEVLKAGDSSNGGSMKQINSMKNEMIKACDDRRIASQANGVVQCMAAFAEYDSETYDVDADWLKEQIQTWQPVSANLAIKEDQRKVLMDGLAALCDLVAYNVSGERVVVADLEAVIGIGLKVATLLKRKGTHGNLSPPVLFAKCVLEGATEICEYKKALSDLAARGTVMEEVAEKDVDAAAWIATKQQLDIVTEGGWWGQASDCPLDDKSTATKDAFNAGWETLKQVGIDYLGEIIGYKAGVAAKALSASVEALRKISAGGLHGHSWKEGIDESITFPDLATHAKSILSDKFGEGFEKAIQVAKTVPSL